MSNDAATPYASYVPRDLPYNEDFEDSVMRVVLNSNTKQDGLRIVTEDSDEIVEDGISIRASDVDQSTLPKVNRSELPMRLTNARRVYASSVPGIKLTHPGGFLEGGPGLNPNEDTFAREFLTTKRSMSTPEALQGAIQNEVESNLQLLRQRMEARQRAKEQNEQIDKDIRTLVDQHNMEMKIQKRMVEEHKAKKEARERKKRDKDGG